MSKIISTHYLRLLCLINKGVLIKLEQQTIDTATAEN